MPTKRGWHWDAANSRLDVYVDGTKAGYFDDTGSYFTSSAGMTITSGGLTVTAGGATITAGGLTVTAGGLTVTAGAVSVAAEDLSIGDGYLLKLGSSTEFGTTAGTNGILFKAGTAPDGTCTNCCQLYSDNGGDDLSVEHADGTEDELTS